MTRLSWFVVVVLALGTTLYVAELVESAFPRWSAAAVGGTTVVMLWAVTRAKRRSAGWWGVLCIPPVALGSVLALAALMLSYREVMKLGPAVTPRDLASGWYAAFLAGGLGLLGCFMALAAGFWTRPTRAATRRMAPAQSVAPA